MLVDIISVPYRYDRHGEGIGGGPDALRSAGLADRLRQVGLAIGAEDSAHLADSEREDGRTAINIGKLGANTAQLVRASRQAGHSALVLAGDDTAAIGVVAGLQAAAGAGTPIGIVWLDAHGDFNTPETSYSGILAGMPLAILAGLAGPLWREAAGLAAPIATDRLVLAGTRDLDEKEAELLRTESLTEEELKRAKAKIIGQRKIARQELGSFATTTALDELYGLGFGYNDSEDARIEAVTLADVKAVAQKYLRPDAAVVAIINPGKP